MPYIKQDSRDVLNPHLEKLAREVTTEGDLNYCIYKLSCLLIDKMGESYYNYCMCSSAMEHSKLELYRKCVSPYEDKKISENRDI
jgi:hypothetical protein